MQTDAGLARTLQQVKVSDLIPENQVRLCVRADGEPWSWNQLHERFPSAVEILDDYHCCEHLQKVASLQYVNRPARQPERCETTVAWLLWGEGCRGVSRDLQRMQPADAQAAEKIDKLIGYLQRYQERFDYGFSCKGGYSIGSGGIKSAKHFVCYVRRKRSGAWWYIENTNHILALRCAKYKTTFDPVVERYRKRIQALSGRKPSTNKGRHPSTMQLYHVINIENSYVIGKINCAWMVVYRMAFGRLWPLTLATPIYVLPIIYMYLTFQIHWHDSGTLLNIINNLFERGEFYYYDWNTDYFNNHFPPFFYVLSPLVHLTRSLFFLLLLFSLAFAASAWLYYKFAKEVLGSSSLAALCYVTLVTNPYFMAGNLYPHYEVFMALALMGFALLAVRGNTWLALLCLVIALSVKEDVWIYGMAASLILLGRISTRHAALYLGTAAAYYVVVLDFVYPILYPNAVNLDYFLQVWAYGQSKGEVLHYLVTHPWDTGKRLITGSGLDFNLSYLFLPVLAGWRFLICLAVLYLWVNSTDIYRSSLAFYYNLPCVVLYALTLPFALIHLERLWAWLRTRFPPMIPAPTAVQTVLVAMAAVGIFWLVRPPQPLTRSQTLPNVFAHELRIHQFIPIYRALNSILADRHKSVLASFTIGAYVPPRGKLFLMHIDAHRVMNGSLRPDFVIFDLRQSQPYFSEEAVRYFFAYVEASPEYRIEADINNIIIFAKH